MENHSQRSHSTWSASATSRNWQCAGSLVLSEQVAHLEKESEAAAWGTACHEVAEWCLREGREAIEMIGRTVKTKEHSIEVDEEMAETAQVYVDYVRGRFSAANPTDSNHPDDWGCLMVEQRFSLEKLKPPFDAGGTADAVIYFPAEKLLEVIDLKGGRGVKVDVTENKQLRTYALGAVLANPGLDVTRVRSTIVQPRMNHKDGPVRSEEYHIADLTEWTGELLEKMHKSREAWDAYSKITGDISREEWGEKYLTAGDHCANSFCPARGFCPKLQKQALDAAGVWFDDLDQPKLSNTPDSLDPARLAQMLDAADMVTDFFNACRALAHSLAETGVEIPNYQLVEKIGRRRWTDEKKAREHLFLTADLTDDDMFEAKFKSPAQMEKVLGAKRKALLDAVVEKPVTGKNLVRCDKTNRPAVKAAVHEHFNIIE